MKTMPKTRPMAIGIIPLLSELVAVSGDLVGVILVTSDEDILGVEINTVDECVGVVLKTIGVTLSDDGTISELDSVDGGDDEGTMVVETSWTGVVDTGIGVLDGLGKGTTEFPCTVFET